MSSKKAPAPSVVRWVRPFRTQTSALLRIKGGLYEVVQLRDPVEGVVGYQIFKLDGSGVRYAVDVTGAAWTCECGDFIHRRDGRDARGCKHVRALKAALAAA